MSQSHTLLKLTADVPPQAQAPLARVLRQIIHDTNSPIATIDMDVFSLRRAVDRLRAAAGSSADDRVRQQLAEVESICANLERASAKLQGYLEQVAKIADNAGGEDRS